MIRDSEEFRKKATMYKRWKKKYKDYCQMVEDLEYEESKIPSMFPDTIRKQRGKNEDGSPKYITVAIPMAHGDPKQKQIRRLEQIERKSELEKARDDYLKKCYEVEEALNRLPDPLKRLMIEIYVEKVKTIDQAAQQLGYTKTGLAARIYRSLTKYLSI